MIFRVYVYLPEGIIQLDHDLVKHLETTQLSPTGIPVIARLIAEGHAIAAHDPGHRGFAPLLIRPSEVSSAMLGNPNGIRHFCWWCSKDPFLYPFLCFWPRFNGVEWGDKLFFSQLLYMTPKITFCWGRPISGTKSIGIGIMFILVFHARGQALRPRRTRQFYHASSWYFPLPKRCSHHPKWWCPDNLPGSPSGGYTEWYFEVWSWNGTNRRFLANNILNLM